MVNMLSSGNLTQVASFCHVKDERATLQDDIAGLKMRQPLGSPE